MVRIPPTSLIIFGSTGDLMAKKIIPALFHVFREDHLPANFNVIGVGRREWGDQEFRAHVREALASGKGGAPNTEELERFLGLFSYERVRFDAEGDYKTLSESLDRRDSERGATNRLLYLAVPPDLFPVIFDHPSFRDMVRESSSHASMRVIVEKPFGRDAASAALLEKSLATCFTEDQIYRVDHYLTKEILQGIPPFRFANNLFEHNWHGGAVSSIHIRLWETLGVENRGNFYDPVGALRDVGQNHVLEMLALTTMDQPARSENLREKRAEIIESLRTPAPDEMAASSYRAQYRGYRDIAGVKPDSSTETYFKIVAHLDHPRWKGIPIVMESGKRMHEKRKEIIVRFKGPYENTVAFRLEPRDEIVVGFLAKKPGIFEKELESRSLRFQLNDDEGRTQYVSEYGKMILGAAAGDKELFVSREEVAATWAFTDAFTSAWERNAVPLASYQPDTEEPVNDSEFIEQGLESPDPTFGPTRSKSSS